MVPRVTGRAIHYVAKSPISSTAISGDRRLMQRPVSDRASLTAWRAVRPKRVCVLSVRWRVRSGDRRNGDGDDDDNDDDAQVATVHPKREPASSVPFVFPVPVRQVVHVGRISTTSPGLSGHRSSAVSAVAAAAATTTAS